MNTRSSWLSSARYGLGLVLCSVSSLGSSHVFAQKMDETWTVTVNGQTVQVEPDGSFRIANIAAPDVLPQATPGGPPCCDFFSDEYLRVIGVSPAYGLYSSSTAFQIGNGQTYVLGDLTISSEPPPFPESIGLTVTPSTILDPMGTAAANVLGTLYDGVTQIDVSSRAAGTIYTSSNPGIASVDMNGGITPHKNGTVFITSTNEGATAVAKVVVSLGDPLTEVAGVVLLEDGQPAVGATVEVLGLPRSTAVTGPGGDFSIAGVVTTVGPLAVNASTVVDTTPLGGISVAVEPMPEGVTDVGIVVVDEFIPVTIDFDMGVGSPVSYTENGMTVTSQQTHLHLGDNSFDGNPDLLNHSGCCSTPYVFDFGGQSFNVVSLEVVLHDGSVQNFTSSTGDLQQVSGVGTYVFPGTGWQGLTSFSWAAFGNMAIDNIVFEVTP